MSSKTTIVLVCLAVILLFPAPGCADNQLEASFMGFYPQRDLGGQLGRAYGIAGGYTRTFLAGSPVTLHLGGDIGYVTYGKEYRSVPYSSEVTDVFVDIQTNNNVLEFGLVGKASLSRGFVRPYAEVKAGYSNFFTESKVVDEAFADPNDTSGYSDLTDTATYTAIGGGLLIPFYTGASDFDPENRFAMMLDLRFLWWWGNRVSYLKPGGITVDQSTGKVTYNTISTRSDRTTAHIGVVVNF